MLKDATGCVNALQRLLRDKEAFFFLHRFHTVMSARTGVVKHMKLVCSDSVLS